MKKSFRIIGSAGRPYSVFFNPQRGYWYVRYKHDGGYVRKSLWVGTRPEAEAKVREMDAPIPLRTETSVRVTWTEFQKRYLNYKTEQGKAERTVARYKATMDAVGRYLAAENIVYADQIALCQLEGFATYRGKTERCDPKTVYTDALVLKNALKWASKPARGILKNNPALDWETPEPVKPKRRTYTAAEVVKLEAGVRSWLRPVVTTLAWTGIRIGELVNLRWKDVDFSTHVLHVRIREDWKPKGRADRTVPLLPKVEVALKTMRVGEYVFTGSHGGRIKESYALASLKKDQEKLVLPKGDLHGFRRFFATTMLRNGVDVEMVRQWGGWKSLETMLRYLADVDVKDSVQAMEAVAKRLATA